MESPDTDIASAKRLQVLLVAMVAAVAIVVMVAMVAAAAIGTGLLVSSCSPRRSEPSVEQLIENYRAHRAAFATIAKMVTRDPDFAIWNPSLGPEDERHGMPTHLSDNREAQYRSLLVEVGGEHLGWGAGEIDVTVGSEGFFNAGQSWGYFHTDGPESSVDTTERARAGGGPEGWCVPLGDGWYANLNRN